MADPTSRPITLITGGSRGIGAATARWCARAGHAVAVNYARDERSGQTLVAELRSLGVPAIAVQADVADEAQVLRMFDAVDRELGTLTGLVNNAGVVDVPTRVDELGVARLKRMFDINVIGSIVCAREATRRMSTRHGGRGGCIVNLSSMAARLGSAGQYVDYAASKGAIDSFTVGLARELAGEGVRVNAIRPGVIDTEIHASGGLPDRARDLAPTIPMGRAGSADEVAAAIGWLLSDAASYTTGAIIDVSGGR